MNYVNSNHSASDRDDCRMTESLKLYQGPGLNGLFLTAAPIAWKYDETSDTATYVLSKDYTLYIRGYPLKEPGIPPLKPENYKLLDILVCKLGESRTSRQVELPFEEFMQLAGYAVTATNKDAVRSKLTKSVALLGALSADWVEENGRYSHHDIKIFDEIACRNSRVYACFSERMALYLRDGCSSMSFPHALFTVTGRSPNSYLLGRRCLVHNASNKDRVWQSIRVGNLLAVCPRIPRPNPLEKWSPSILEKKVISPFGKAMKPLADSGILTWRFREPASYDNYESFADNIVEFRLPDNITHTTSVEEKPACIWSPADTKWFLDLR